MEHPIRRTRSAACDFMRQVPATLILISQSSTPCLLPFLTCLRKDETLPRTYQHTCTHADCTREMGFRSPHDLHRHQRSKHGDKSLGSQSSGYHCPAENCNREKLWPRLDNLKQHIAKVHSKEDTNNLIAR